jgi:hypothetical protein
MKNLKNTMKTAMFISFNEPPQVILAKSAAAPQYPTISRLATPYS